MERSVIQLQEIILVKFVEVRRLLFSIESILVFKYACSWHLLKKEKEEKYANTK